MVMRVIEQPGQVGNPTDDLATILPRTPRLVMADGSEQSTVWIQRPNDLDGPTKQWVRSGQLFKYDLFHNELWMTDGTWCKYDDNGWLVLFTDPFGNAVQLDRQTTPGTLVVTQFLGTNGEQRVVTLSLDPGGRPERMEYLDRVWQYSYNGLPNAMSRDIETVTLPEGLHWSFAYEDGPLSDVTTPQMGHVAYNYEIRRIFNPQ
jgi:hypothetical protein